jgi:hypothetical protein
MEDGGLPRSNGDGPVVGLWRHHPKTFDRVFSQATD